jgi:hypothetical protein
MKNKIKEVQDYLKGKILTGDFKTLSSADNVVDIIIDGEFKFSLWVNEGYSFEQWTTRNNAMYLGVFTLAEQEQGFAIFSPIKIAAETERLMTIELDKFNELKTKLEAAGVINQAETEKES